MNNHIDDGGRPEAAVDEASEFIHSCLLRCTNLKVRNTMALVPSSHGTIYERNLVSKSVHRNDENRHFITVKYVKDPPKWADDDRADWTMKATVRD